VRRRAFIALPGDPKWEEAGMLTNKTFARGETPMLRSVPIIIVAIALGVAAWLLPMRGEQATAQPGTPHILVVEFDIVPAEIDKFMTEIKELGAWAAKELGCRQFSIAISQKDPNHVLLFEVWDSAAAVDAQFATDRFKKYQATTANMVAKRDIRTYTNPQIE
jgi:(4S)-4-hydroxy-5-phosphonooxypentane-2,3-dione isomerase